MYKFYSGHTTEHQQGLHRNRQTNKLNLREKDDNINSVKLQYNANKHQQSCALLFQLQVSRQIETTVWLKTQHTLVFLNGNCNSCGYSAPLGDANVKKLAHNEDDNTANQLNIGPRTHSNIWSLERWRKNYIHKKLDKKEQVNYTYVEVSNCKRPSITVTSIHGSMGHQTTRLMGNIGTLTISIALTLVH